MQHDRHALTRGDAAACGDEAGRLARWRSSALARSYFDRAPSAVATVTSILGIVNLVVALVPHERRWLRQGQDLLPIELSAAAVAVLAVCGLLLWRLGSELRRRKRRAWRAAIVVYAVLVVAHVLHGTLVAAAVSFVLLVALLTTSDRFRARADPVSRWVAVKIAAQFAVVSFVWGMLLLTVGAGTDRVRGAPSIWQRAQEVLLAMVGGDGPVEYHRERFGDVVHGTLGAFSLIGLVLVVLVVLRPAEAPDGLSATDERRLRELLETHGRRDSLGYFALRRDKRVVWSPTGKAAITGRVVSGVFLVSGDPIGDPEAWPGAIAEYLKRVGEYGWVPAVIGCSELGATVFAREAELSAIELGDEAVIEVDGFCLDGRAMRGVRQACSRAERAGYEVAVRRTADVAASEFRELSRAASAWRADSVERGFSMALSRMGDPADGRCVVATATLPSADPGAASAADDARGALKGLLHFVPWGPDGLSLDLMRRDRGADNGLNEFMIVRVIEAARDLGVSRVSLNFAVFRDAIERGERIGAGPILRVWRSILLFASRWWQIESLYRFNVKFRPEWEPRFLCFPATRDLPRIAVAAMEAEAFITRPHRLRRLLGRA